MRLFFLILFSVAFLELSAQSSSIKTAVTFTTNDSLLAKVYSSAEEKCLKNIQQFGQYKVLVEGAGYPNVWLETQPMGGYMYAKRNLEIAKNNIEIFIANQRSDGRLPGMIGLTNYPFFPGEIRTGKDSLSVYYGWLQGFCFPSPAFELYYWLQKDKVYLKRLYASLEHFDNYLWKTRDSDGDGCLETWCVWDTGEDMCIRLENSPDGWGYDFPPSVKFLEKMDTLALKKHFYQQPFNKNIEIPVPMESMDIMSYSYSARHILSLISKVLSNGKELFWKNKALAVRSTLKNYLWDKKKQACFDRGADNKTLPALIHNNLRCMYFGSFDQEMADAFVKKHLMNQKEFWTPMPLPSIAANDSLFRNISGNNWSGQPQGLTYQRSIEALENYGHFAELTLIGKKLLSSTKRSLHFSQQFDPFTGEPNNSGDGYGPTMLSVLEFISRLYGVHYTKDKLLWSSITTDGNYSSTYKQTIGDKEYTLTVNDNLMNAFINGKKIFTCSAGVRIVTDDDGSLLEITGIDEIKHSITFKSQHKNFNAVILPNGRYVLNKTNQLKQTGVVEFVHPW